MKDRTMATIRIILTIKNLGAIPEHQETKLNASKIETYFNEGVCDEPLTEQLKLFGARELTNMVKAELTSWLDFLDTQPDVIAVEVHD